uniref:Uncharacterized protein n=1 Tax=uncultured bacterium contig00005 TaxID=1181497 RepID=A0A806KPA7_9BACT|nr:hypothetical protein [uncultured bacterium contig00005]
MIIHILPDCARIVNSNAKTQKHKPERTADEPDVARVRV